MENNIVRTSSDNTVADDLSADLQPLLRAARAALPVHRDPAVDAHGLALVEQRLARGPGRRFRTLLATLSLGVACAAAVAIVVARLPLRYSVEGGFLGPDGRVYSASQGGAVEFSDGTKLELAPQAQARVAGVARHGARIEVNDGRVTAHVRKKQHASWSFGAGPFSVLVTGTAFDLSWSPSEQRMEIVMREGSVDVVGPRLGTGRHLIAGQSLVATVAATPRDTTTDADAAARAPTSPPREHPNDVPNDDPHAAPSGVSAKTSAAHAARATSLGDAFDRGQYSAVLALVKQRGLTNFVAYAPARELREASDAARYMGRADDAQRMLIAARHRFPRTSDAADAAFLLGRLTEDNDPAAASPGSHPTRAMSAHAVRWYDVYLAEAPRGPYAAEAQGRKMSALVRDGNIVDARLAARAYLRALPQGPYSAAARQLLAR